MLVSQESKTEIFLFTTATELRLLAEKMEALQPQLGESCTVQSFHSKDGRIKINFCKDI